MRSRESVELIADKLPGGPLLEQRVARSRRVAIALAVLAVAIYFGFILMMAWR